MSKFQGLISLLAFAASLSASAGEMRFSGRADAAMILNVETTYQDATRRSNVAAADSSGRFEVVIPTQSASQAPISQVALNFTLNGYEDAQVVLYGTNTNTSKELPSALEIKRIEIQPSAADVHFQYLTPFVVSSSGRELMDLEFLLPSERDGLNLSFDLRWRYPSSN